MLIYKSKEVNKMLTFEIKRGIYYRWESTEAGPVSTENIALLEEHALKRITERRKKGCFSGELHCSIVENGKEIEISGWWNSSTK